MNKIVRFIAVGIVLMAMGWSVQFNGHHVSKSTMDGGALVFDTKEALKIYLKSKRLVQSVFSVPREGEPQGPFGGSTELLPAMDSRHA